MLAIPALACASASRYTTGPEPLAPLPEPLIRLWAAAPGSPDPASVATLEARGSVQRTWEAPGPNHGVRVDLQGPGGRAAVEVRTFVPVRLDLAPGQAVRVSAVSAGAEARVRLDGDDGPLFWAFAGSVPPDARGLPLEVRPALRRAWVEVSSSDDLCRWTLAQRPVEVTAGGTSLAVLSPGAAATVESGGRRYRVVSAVSSSPEESDCGREGEPRLAFFWWRL